MVIVTLFMVFVVVPSSTTIPKVLDARQLRPLHVVAPKDVEYIESKRMLEAHYQSARSTIPIDMPLKPIGACPYSKPQSTDLPIPNIPMNVVMNSRDMRLHNVI